MVLTRPGKSIYDLSFKIIVKLVLSLCADIL